MKVEGMFVPGLGDGVHSILVVKVCVAVYVDLDWNKTYLEEE